MSPRGFLISGLILLLLAVVLGAFGAHALKALISAQQLQVWRTANDYQFYHALGLLGLGIWSSQQTASRWIKLSGYSLLLGVLVFSGSLYAMVISGISWLGMITPLGGILFLLGWMFWLIAVLTQPRSI